MWGKLTSRWAWLEDLVSREFQRQRTSGLRDLFSRRIGKVEQGHAIRLPTLRCVSDVASCIGRSNISAELIGLNDGLQ